jgi:hypothetical protein
MIGAWPPCSVVQVSLATSNIVGSIMAAMPAKKTTCGHIAERAETLASGGLTSSKGETWLSQGVWLSPSR